MADRKPLVLISGQPDEMPSGDTLGVANGGTGATSATSARSNIGAAHGMHGFADRADSIISFSGSTFTLAPVGSSYRVWIGGNGTTVQPGVADITAARQVAGVADFAQTFFYLSADGSQLLSNTTGLDFASGIMPVATVIRSGTHYILNDWRWLRDGDYRTEVYSEFSGELRWISGFDATFTGTTFTIGAGKWQDGDIIHDIPEQTTCTLLRRSLETSEGTTTTDKPAGTSPSTVRAGGFSAAPNASGNIELRNTSGNIETLSYSSRTDVGGGVYQFSVSAAHNLVYSYPIGSAARVPISTTVDMEILTNGSTLPYHMIRSMAGIAYDNNRVLSMVQSTSFLAVFFYATGDKDHPIAAVTGCYSTGTLNNMSAYSSIGYPLSTLFATPIVAPGWKLLYRVLYTGVASPSTTWPPTPDVATHIIDYRNQTLQVMGECARMVSALNAAATPKPAQMTIADNNFEAVKLRIMLDPGQIGNVIEVLNTYGTFPLAVLSNAGHLTLGGNITSNSLQSRGSSNLTIVAASSNQDIIFKCATTEVARFNGTNFTYLFTSPSPNGTYFIIDGTQLDGSNNPVSKGAMVSFRRNGVQQSVIGDYGTIRNDAAYVGLCLFSELGRGILFCANGSPTPKMELTTAGALIIGTDPNPTGSEKLRVGGPARLESLALTADLPITEGGTGASTAAAARTNLGIGHIETFSVDVGGCADSTWYTGFTMSAGFMYNVKACMYGTRADIYMAWATCGYGDGLGRMTVDNPDNPGGLHIRMTGGNVEVMQHSGTTQTINVRYWRM